MKNYYDYFRPCFCFTEPTNKCVHRFNCDIRTATACPKDCEHEHYVEEERNPDND